MRRLTCDLSSSSSQVRCWVTCSWTYSANPKCTRMLRWGPSSCTTITTTSSSHWRSEFSSSVLYLHEVTLMNCPVTGLWPVMVYWSQFKDQFRPVGTKFQKSSREMVVILFFDTDYPAECVSTAFFLILPVEQDLQQCKYRKFILFLYHKALIMMC